TPFLTSYPNSIFFYCSRHHRALHSFPTRRSSDLSLVRRREDRLDVEQELVHPDLEYAVDGVFRLAGMIPECPARAKLPDPHVAARPRHDLVGQAATVMAGDVFIALVRGPGQPALEKRCVVAPAPWTF